LADDAPERDMDARRLFGIDFKTTATGYLAVSVLALGDAERARDLIDQAVREGGESDHVATIANTTVHKVLLESFRVDPAATLSAGERVVEFARKHNMAAYAAAGELFLLWARFRTAIEIAKQQGSRSFGLRAALSLAKLYQSTGRSSDAHAVLAPALEGFSPTSEMPEIAEAQALLAALAETTEVKAASAQRQRRLDLQTSYSHALMWGKGFAAEETKDRGLRCLTPGAKEGRDALRSPEAHPRAR
jgi:hypothetical protein